MKNKKKASSEIHSKNQSKYDKHEPSVIVKKSPLKHKTQQPKSQTQPSLDGGNFSMHPFKQTALFYGKKYHYSEINPKKVSDSNQSSTHCSFNNRSGKQKSFQNRKPSKSKLLKAAKNQEFYQQQIEEQEEIEIKLNSKQILQLINSYATKIQRQWRRYWFRKCLRFIVLKERERKQYELLNGFYGIGGKAVEKCRISQDFYQERRQAGVREGKSDNKRHTLPKLNVSSKRSNHQDEVQVTVSSDSSQSVIERQRQQSSNDNQLTEQFYNNQKYASLSSYNSGKIISNIDLAAKNQESHHQRTSSFGEIFLNAQKTNLRTVEMVEVGLNCSLKSLKEISEHERHFDTPVSGLTGVSETSEKKSSDKKSNIKLQTKVYECQVIEKSKLNSHLSNNYSNKPSELTFSKNLTEQFKKKQKLSSNIKSSQSINSKYDTKFPSQQSLQHGPKEVTKIFKKYKKAIQKQGIKKITKIQKHFQDKQITQRTYKNLLQQTKQKLNKEIKTLEIKEGHFRNSWKEVYVMFKDYVKENSFHQGDTHRSQAQKNIHENQLQKDEHSISFDKWDFESSAKKSISHLQSFEEFARQLNERNPQKLKGFFVDNRKLLSDNKPIELVLDQLDRLENELEKREEVSEFREEEGGSIFEEFKQRERTNSFQKKVEKVLVEDIKEKVSYAELKSPHASPRLSPKQVSIPSISLKKPLNPFRPEQQLPILQNKEFFSPRRQKFQFPEINTPQKSIQRFRNSSPIEQLPFIKTNKNIEKIKTDESDEGSEVQIKITSINVEEKKESEKEENSGKDDKKDVELFVPEDGRQKLQNCILRQLQEKKEFEKIEENKRLKEKEKLEKSIRFIETLGDNYYKKLILPRLSPVITSTTRLLIQTYRQRQYRQQQQQIQLRKYPQTIDPTIDSINNWLLEISHHLLDHHNPQIKKNLLHVKQIPQEEMLQICHSQKLSNAFYDTHSYITISQKIFKEFEFFYLKNVANNLEIDDQHQQNFQHLLYAFHRCLIDSMNSTLLDELSIGRNWVMIPWVNSFRYCKNESPEHTKQCLERVINRVSGWGEYCLAQLGTINQPNYAEWKQYQEERMNLVIRQEVLEEPLENQFVLSHVIMKICEQIWQEEMELAGKEIQFVFIAK